MSKPRSTSRSQLIKTLDQHPAMPALLQSMPPRTAAALLQRIGIADAAELMTLVPADTLLRTLDESIWKSARPGARESVDVAELIEWLQTWHDIGESFLLERLAAMSDDYLVLVLSCLLRVDTATQHHSDYGEMFDACVEERPNQAERFGPFEVHFMHEDYRDVARSTVHALWAESSERLLRVFGRMSHAAGTAAAHRGWVTTALDVEFERESFREAQGYVSAAGARAFLVFASNLTFEQVQALTQYDLETRRHLDRHLRSVGETADAAHPVHASGRSVTERPTTMPEEPVAPSSVAGARTESLAALQTLLEDAGLIEPVSEQLRLTGPNQTQASSEAVLAAQLRRLAAEHPQRFQDRARELAYLANVLKAAVSVHGAGLSDSEAKEAAFATCNLGVELAPHGDTSHLQGEPGLIRAFLYGWCTLHRIAARIVASFDHAASALSSWIRDEASVGLQDLRSAVAARRWPDAREAVVFLTIAFDTATCRALGPLLDEIPRYSLLLEGSKQPDAARWITSRADLDRIAALLSQLAPKRPQR